MLFLSQELWSILAANIVHCEIETRGSLSTAPHVMSPGDVEGGLLQLWGGASAHWRALRALSGLAVLSTIFIDHPVSEDRTAVLTRWQTELGEPERSESASQARGGAAKGSSLPVGSGETSGLLAGGGDSLTDRASMRNQDGTGMTGDLPRNPLDNGPFGTDSLCLVWNEAGEESVETESEGKVQSILQEGPAMSNDPFAVLIFLFMVSCQVAVLKAPIRGHTVFFGVLVFAHPIRCTSNRQHTLVSVLA